MKTIILGIAAAGLLAGSASAQCFKGHKMSMAQAEPAKAPVSEALSRPVTVAGIATDAWLIKYLA